MRCAKGIFAKGIWGRTGFSLLRWEKRSEIPSCDGKESETPSFLILRHRERGSLRPFSPSQEGVSDPFPHRKRGETLYIPESPWRKSPEPSPGGIHTIFGPDFARMGFALFQPRKPVFVRSSSFGPRNRIPNQKSYGFPLATARFGKNASSENKMEKMLELLMRFGALRLARYRLSLLHCFAG